MSPPLQRGDINIMTSCCKYHPVLHNQTKACETCERRIMSMLSSSKRLKWDAEDDIIIYCLTTNKHQSAKHDSRFKFVLLADQITVIENKISFRHQDLQMFGLKLKKYG